MGFFDLTVFFDALELFEKPSIFIFDQPYQRLRLHQLLLRLLQLHMQLNKLSFIF